MENAHGEQVPRVVNVDPDGQDLFQCDPDTALYGDGSGEWERVWECNSGLNHDEDGLIDHDRSWYHTAFDDKDHDPDYLEREADKDVACPERAVKVEDGESTEIVAQYVDNDGECTVPRDEDGNTDVNDIEEDIDGGDILTETEPEVTECINDEENLLEDQQSYCSQLDYDGFGADVMPVVEYGPTEEYFEQLDAIRDRDLDSDGVETRFVNHWGWDTPQWQSVYQAERKYDLYGGDSCIWCHNPDFWRDQVGLEHWDVYDDDDPSNHEDAWTTENAGSRNENVYTPENPDSEEEIFDGGFAGICEGGQVWQYDRDEEDEELRWRCSGNIPWDQPVMLPETSDFVTLIVPHTNLMTGDELIDSEDWSFFESFPVAVDAMDNAEHWGSLDTLNATCWVGGVDRNPFAEGNDYPPEDEYIQDQSVNVDEESPFGIYGEVEISGSESYSCYWEYETDTGETVSALGDVHTIQEEDSSLSDEGRDLKEDHLENIPGLAELEEESHSLSEFEEIAGDWAMVEVQ